MTGVELIRGLFVAEPFDHAQPKHVLVDLRESGNDPSDLFELQVPRGFGVYFARGGEIVFTQDGRNPLRPTPACPLNVEGQVVRRGQQPRQTRCAGQVDTTALSPQQQECILGHFFGVRCGINFAPREQIYRPDVAVMELAQGGVISIA